MPPKGPSATPNDQPDADGDDADEDRDAARRPASARRCRARARRSRASGRPRAASSLCAHVDRRRRIRRPDQRQRGGDDERPDERRAQPQARAARAGIEIETRVGSRCHAAVPQARIDRGAGDVDEEVHHDHDARQQHHASPRPPACRDWTIDWKISRPRPGSTNTFSTTIAPAIRLANCSPMIVRIGVSALGSA